MPFDETSSNPLWLPQSGEDSNTIELVESFPTKAWDSNDSDHGGGSSKAGSEEEFITAIHKEDESPVAATHAKKPTIQRRRLGILVLAILLLVIVAVVVAVVLATTKEEEDSESKSSAPFSALDPVTDLGVFKFTRPEESSPSSRLKLSPARTAFPTNAWYQNLLLLLPDQEPSQLHRVYTIPYVVDTAGPIPGLRIHAHHLDATSTTVTLAITEPYAVTLGATRDFNTQEDDDTNGYSVVAATELGVTLEWDSMPMKSSIVRGMLYLTMRYESTKFQAQDGGLILPTLWSDMPMQSAMVDGAEVLECSSEMVPQLVSREIKLAFQIAETTWLLFFSRPVHVQCSQEDGPFLLQVADQDDAPLIIRLALVTNNETDEGESIKANAAEYETILREHAHVYPGDTTLISYEINDAKAEATVTLDWDAQTVTPSADNETQLVMFALPHHLDKIGGIAKFCKASLFGQTCLVEGNSWTMKEELPQTSFQAPRHPAPQFLPALTQALQEDLRFTIPPNFQIGAGDTYFSGKILGKLARIILIAEEVMELCAYVRQSDPGQDIDGYSRDEYLEACNNSYHPTDDDVNEALLELQRGIEIWISGEAQAPFVYDAAWGGMVNCGCDYLDGVCLNTLPDCPAFTDRGLNFGNGFYNDHHFHYGYHIYAAAVATHFDQEWGRQHFDKMFLLVRDIANPTVDDTAFPIFRQKDWFQGSSWASGIGSPPFLNGRNQESSSEAVAAYEAVALFGSAMASAFEEIGNTSKAAGANEVRQVGELLTATEMRSAKRYWHVEHENESKRIYPAVYEPNVVGICWNTMIQFGTWFGREPYLVYGIQLIPLTPISENLVELDWAFEMYGPFAQECEADPSCGENGWSTLVLAVLATVGHTQVAAQRAQALSADVYDTPGGNGHSTSNTLWFISTRPQVSNPLPLDCDQPGSCGEENTAAPSEPGGSEVDCSQPGACPEENTAPPVPLTVPPVPPTAPPTLSPGEAKLDCGRPGSCTDAVLNTLAGEFSCRDRITWLLDNMGFEQFDACTSVAAAEFPNECGLCDPSG